MAALLLGALAALLLVVLTLVQHLRKDRRLPPGPRGLPVLGSLLSLDPQTPHLSLTAMARRYAGSGGVFGLRLGGVYAVVLSEARLVREAFSKDACSGRAPLYLTHGIMRGHGLICAEGALWRDQRKFVATVLKNLGMVKFGPRRDKMEGVIAAGVDECLKALEDLGTGDPLVVLQHAVGNVMNAIIFGRTWDKDDETWRWLLHLQEEGVRLIGVSGALNFLPFLRFLPHHRKTLEVVLDGQRRQHGVYRSFAQEHPAGDSDVLGAFKAEASRRSSLPQHLVEEKTPPSSFYTDTQMIFLVTDLFGAGLDTTVTTLRWFLLFMADNLHIQDEVWAELSAAVGGGGGGEEEASRRPRLDDMVATPLFEASLCETQRIRSVVPVGIPHGTVQDMTIGGFHVPKGTMVIPLQWAIHMDPERWSEPERFDPRRFLSEDGKVSKPDCFIPFQTGKRMCVGDELARMILYLVGSAIVHRFRVTPAPGSSVDLEGEAGITLTPKTQDLVFTPRR